MFTADLLELHKPTVPQIAGAYKCEHWDSCFGVAGRISTVVKKAGFVSLPPNEGSIRTAAPRKSNLRGRLWNAAARLIPMVKAVRGIRQDVPESYGK